MANPKIIKFPVHVTQNKLMGGIFAFSGIALSLLMANVLVDMSHMEGLKLSIVIFVAGVTLLWYLTTERIPLALILLIVFMGVFEGYLKLNTSGSAYYVIYAARNVLTIALGLNVLFKARMRKLEEIGIDFSWPPFSLLIGFYLLWCLINIFHPDGINLMNSIAGVRPHIEFVPLYFLGFLVCKKDPKWYTHLLITFVIIGVLNAVAAIHQYKLGPEALSQVWGPGYEKLVGDLNGNIQDPATVRDKIGFNARVYYDSNYNLILRPPGLGSDHSFPAMVAQISMFAVLVLLFYYLKMKNYWMVGFLALSALLLFAGIIVSASRSYLLLTIVGLAIGLLFYMREIFSGQKLKIVVLLIIAGAIWGGNYALKSYISESVYDRFQNVSTPGKLYERLEEEKFSNWDYTRYYLFENPLGRGLGKVGPGAAFFATSVEDAMFLGNGETEVNFVLSELGIVGLFLLYIPIIATFLKSSLIIRTSAADTYQRLSSMVVFLYLLAFLLNSFFGTGAMFPQKACIWLLMGCFWALHNRQEKFFLPTKYHQW